MTEQPQKSISIKEAEAILKKLGLNTRPAFLCLCITNSFDKNSVSFYFGAQSVEFELAQKQFVYLKTFLQNTITKKTFDGDEQGFTGFDITKNLTHYFSNLRQKEIINKYKNDRRDIRLKELKRETAEVLKTKLARKIYITFNDVTITLTKKNFYIFRDAVLKKVVKLKQ